jgi:hypothetical protein
MFFGNDNVIGWLSANGTVSNLTWCTLTNANVTNPLLLRGSLYVDQTETFSNNLVAVTGDDAYELNGKGVWRVDAQKHVVLLTNIFTRHLEGVITVTNDAQTWGPWAGKILTGDEGFLDENSQQRPLIYTVDTNGAVASFALGIHPEDFDIIPPNQDLYACDPASSQIMKLSRSLLTNYVGDLMITDAGEFGGPAKLFIVHWDGSEFEIRAIPYIHTNGFGGQFEHVTFAPINLPSHPE